MTSKPWLVPITLLERAHGSTRRERRTGSVGQLSVAGSVVAQGTVVDADAVLTSVDGGIEVRAVVTARWSGECRRCLVTVESDLRCEVRELYRPRDPGEKPGEDEETYPLRGDHLDLEPLVRDALLLGLPVAPLCRPDCRGLCPSCGTDRNGGPCGCAETPDDPRWAALEGLGDDRAEVTGSPVPAGEGGTGPPGAAPGTTTA
jgi:uncharacterized protein